MSHEYAALLKAHRDIPVLSTGINNTVTQESTFPTKEHPSLLTHTGKTKIFIFTGRGGGGQVVGVLAFYSHDPSLHPVKAYSFSAKIVFEKDRK